MTRAVQMQPRAGTVSSKAPAHLLYAAAVLASHPANTVIHSSCLFIYMLTHLNTNFLTYSFIYTLTHLLRLAAADLFI